MENAKAVYEHLVSKLGVRGNPENEIIVEMDYDDWLDILSEELDGMHWEDVMNALSFLEGAELIYLPSDDYVDRVEVDADYEWIEGE